MLNGLVAFVALGVAACACTAFSDAEVPHDGGGAKSGTGGSDASVGGSGANGANGGSGGSAASGGAGTGGGATGGSAGSAPSCSGCGATECECSPLAPTGWTHVRIVETLDGSTPQCPTGYGASAVKIGKGAVDSGCGACSCGAFDPASAGNCDQIWQWGGICSGTPTAKTGAAEGACVSMSGSFVKRGLSAGACPPSATPAPAAFSTSVTLCEASEFGSGCGQDACIAVPKPPFEAARCVLSQIEGDVPCPAGFSVKRSYNTTFIDARTCAGCACDLSDVTCSGGTAKWCDDAACANCPYMSSIPGNCTSTDGHPYEVLSGTATPTSGTCTPSGSATSSGSVTASGVRVVCCTG